MGRAFVVGRRKFDRPQEYFGNLCYRTETLMEDLTGRLATTSTL